MTDLRIVPTSRFTKDLKRLRKRGYDLDLLGRVVDALALRQQLDSKYRDHALTGNFHNCRKCRITPDWLLIYEIDDDELILYLTRTGNHSDLF